MNNILSTASAFPARPPHEATNARKTLGRIVWRAGGSVATAIVALSLTGTPSTAEVVEQILVKVNGEIFTKTDLEARQVAALRQKNIQGEPNDEQLKKELGTVTPQIMVDAVAE